ncbi:Uncharacterised protein [Yersinia kristensenii]|nr:Uncharacterised protein [Yersinia kristensenii]
MLKNGRVYNKSEHRMVLKGTLVFSLDDTRLAIHALSLLLMPNMTESIALLLSRKRSREFDRLLVLSLRVEAVFYCVI